MVGRVMGVGSCEYSRKLVAPISHFYILQLAALLFTPLARDLQYFERAILAPASQGSSTPYRRRILELVLLTIY